MSNTLRMWRRLTAVIAVSVTLLPVQAFATGASISSLAGDTEIVGSTSGMMTVALSRPVQVTIRDVTISGNGRFAGVLIVPVSPAVRASVEFMQFGQCVSRGCRSGYPGHAFGAAMCCDDITTTTLPAGRYLLYLFADGTPVQARIHIEGLSGKTTLHPLGSVRIHIDVVHPTQELPAPGGATGADSLFAAGETHRVGPAGGALFWSTWKTEPLPYEANNVTSCTYPAEPAPGAATPAYQVPCDGGSNLTNANLGLPGVPTGSYQVATSGPIPGTGVYLSSAYGGIATRPGQLSLGFSHNTDGPAIEAHLLEVWFDF